MAKCLFHWGFRLAIIYKRILFKYKYNNFIEQYSGVPNRFPILGVYIFPVAHRNESFFCLVEARIHLAEGY